MIVAITGPSGSGKSALSSIIREKGYEVIDVDKVAKEIRPTMSEQIIAAFGEQIVTEGHVDNKKLATLVFEDSMLRSRLNDIMFPPIIAKMKEIISIKNKQSLTFFDVPILFRSGAEQLMDKIILVNARYDVRLKRLIEGRKIDPEIAKAQVNSITITYEDIAKCDFCITNNDDDMDHLKITIEDWIRRQR